MEPLAKQTACIMQRVAIIRSMVFMYGFSGSTARFRESANSFPVSTSTVQPCCRAAFTSGSKFDSGGDGCRRSLHELVQSLCKIWSQISKAYLGSCVHVYSLAEIPKLPPPSPSHLGSYTRALLVSQDKRHFFVTPWVQPLSKIKSRKQEHFPFSRNNLK